MKTSLWHQTVDRQPDNSGHYLAYKIYSGYSLGDDTTDIGYFYYNKSNNNWYDNSLNQAYSIDVYYWSDADPRKWVDSEPLIFGEPNPSLELAWNNLQEALKQYEIIKNLTT